MVAIGVERYGRTGVERQPNEALVIRIFRLRDYPSVRSSHQGVVVWHAPQDVAILVKLGQMSAVSPLFIRTEIDSILGLVEHY